MKKPAPRRGRGIKTGSSARVAKQPGPPRLRANRRVNAVRGSQRSRASRAMPGPAGDTLQGELSGLRKEVERVAASVKEAIQKIERLALAVADLHDDVADLQASLGDGEVEYGPVEEDNSEMGEGHA